MTLKCPDCSRQFKYGKNLKYHMSNHSCKDRNHICPKCNCKYKLYSSLKRHMKVKHNEKIENLDLPICTEKFNKINYINDKEYECIYCDKKYSNKYVLKKHITHLSGISIGLITLPGSITASLAGSNSSMGNCFIIPIPAPSEGLSL